MDEIELTIDGRPVRVAPGTTLLKAAEQAGVDVPVICYFEHTTANGLCRMCVVESEGGRVLEAACVAQARKGQVVHTRSEKVERARRTILEMLAASVDLSESPQLLSMLEQYQARPERFAEGQRRDHPVIDDNPVYIRDYSQCVLCWRCVQVCAEDAQYSYAINFSGRGFHTSIGTFFNQPMTQTTCVFCGQCVGVCPTGALKAKREWLMEQGIGPEEVFAQTRLRSLGKRSEQGPHQE
jgi:NADH dehydrogenase/NADH:ubiquinone oxidoreductase subunit G